MNLLVAATRAGCRRVVLAGSMEEPDLAAGEAPGSPYAAAKAAQSLYARFFRALYGAPVVTARIFMVYGPGQRDLSKVVPYAILRGLEGQPAELASGARPVDWIHVDDVARGLVALAEAPGIEGRRSTSAAASPSRSARSSPGSRRSSARRRRGSAPAPTVRSRRCASPTRRGPSRRPASTPPSASTRGSTRPSPGTAPSARPGGSEPLGHSARDRPPAARRGAARAVRGPPARARADDRLRDRRRARALGRRAAGLALAPVDRLELSHQPELARLGCLSDRDLFRRLGFAEVESADVSDWEGADHVLDLNQPVPAELHGRYDAVFEAGTIQHVFDLPRVFGNIHALLRPGGRAIHGMAPSSNHVDHGFYMFSPTLFHDFYAANGWRLDAEFLFEFTHYWHRGRFHSPRWAIRRYTPGSLDHLAYGGFGGRQVGLFVVATRLPGATADRIPQQSCFARQAPAIRPARRSPRAPGRRRARSRSAPAARQGAAPVAAPPPAAAAAAGRRALLRLR